jgi:hypothetical protein
MTNNNSMNYRPTVRYDIQYKNYVDEIFHATNLDRNQIMRLALYVMGHTSEGLRILEEFQKDVNTSVPLPSWNLLEDWELWLGRKPNGGGVENVRKKLDTSLKPKNPPIKIHNLSYQILTIKGEVISGEQESTEQPTSN